MITWNRQQRNMYQENSSYTRAAILCRGCLYAYMLTIAETICFFPAFRSTMRCKLCNPYAKVCQEYSSIVPSYNT